MRYRELSKAVSEREVSLSIYREMSREMDGKTDAEKVEISKKYAKMIMETCPPRKKESMR